MRVRVRIRVRVQIMVRVWVRVDASEVVVQAFFTLLGIRQGEGEEAMIQLINVRSLAPPSRVVRLTTVSRAAASRPPAPSPPLLRQLLCFDNCCAQGRLERHDLQLALAERRKADAVDAARKAAERKERRVRRRKPYRRHKLNLNPPQIPPPFSPSPSSPTFFPTGTCGPEAQRSYVQLELCPAAERDGPPTHPGGGEEGEGDRGGIDGCTH